MKIQSTIKYYRFITNRIYKLILITNIPIYFKAGQYLFILINNKSYPFSIASTPMQKKYIELHIGISHNNKSKLELLEYISKKKNYILIYHMVTLG